jgi:hypothetical protein
VNFYFNYQQKQSTTETIQKAEKLGNMLQIKHPKDIHLSDERETEKGKKIEHQRQGGYQTARVAYAN